MTITTTFPSQPHTHARAVVSATTPPRPALIAQLRQARAAYARARARTEKAWQAYYHLVDAQHDRGQWDFQTLEHAAQAAKTAEAEKHRLYHRMNAIEAQLLALTPNS